MEIIKNSRTSSSIPVAQFSGWEVKSLTFPAHILNRESSITPLFSNFPSPNAFFYLFRLNTSFGVGYGAGGVSGVAYRDTITIGEAKATGAYIGAANSTNGFTLVKPIDGICKNPSSYSILFVLFYY